MPTMRLTGHRHQGRPSAIDGALAAATQLALGELAAAAIPGGQSLIAGLGRTLIDATPGPVVDIVVAAAESADKPLMRGTLVAGWVSAAGAAAQLDRHRSARAVPQTLGLLGIAAGTATAIRPDAAAMASLTASGLGTIGAVGALAVLGRRPSAARRGAIAVGAGGAALTTAVLRSGQRTRLADARGSVALPQTSALPPRETSFDVDGLSPLFTPPEHFYVTDVSSTAPHIDPVQWRLKVTGMVQRELELSLDDLLAMPTVELDATLVCVHNPVGGPRIGSARWLGVPLAHVLERAGAELDAQQVLTRSVDGFTAGVPIERVQPPHAAIIALAMNGEPLPIANGFPARLLVPGLWGADANTKWLCELELTTWGAVRDYWDRRGWPRQPSATRPGSRIDVPDHRSILATGQTTLAGVAWAPPHGVDAVEISIDAGSWQPADLSSELAPTMWRQWRYQWDATPGRHLISVRTHGRERAQRQHNEPPYPVGSSGYHTIEVTITDSAPGAIARGAGRAAAALDDVKARARLASAARAAWGSRGYPPAPRWPTPS